MPAHAMNQSDHTTRARRLQLHHVELQGIDARRIINGLAGRSGRTWPTVQGGSRG